METEPINCDIIIVGLGPTGLVLANLLGQYGWSVVALERDEEVYYAPRASHFDDEVMRVFQSIGLSQEVTQASEPFTEMDFVLEPNGKPIMSFKVGSQDGRYGHPGAWWFHQPSIERVLRAGLNRFPKVVAHYGATVTGVEQDNDTAAAKFERGGETQTVRGRYLVGCDGGRSLVRSEVGIELSSAGFDEAWVVVDARTLTGKKHPDLPKKHRQICDPSQPITYVPLTTPYYEWQFMAPADATQAEVTNPDYVRNQLRTFVDLSTIEIIRIAYYKFHALWATDWIAGRVLLAGDAAHQTPPFLGQGMCSGVRDAHNLSWRLDLILRSQADPSLLQAYEDERTAHVQELIKGAMFLGRTIQTRNRFIAALRNNLLFRTAGRIPTIKRAIYRHANRKRPLAGGTFDQANSPLAGYYALQPFVTIADGQIMLLDDVLGNGFALLVRGDRLDPTHPALEQLQTRLPLSVFKFGTLADTDQIGDCNGSLLRWFEQHDIDFVLIRPDRYVLDAGNASSYPSILHHVANAIP